MNTLLLGLAWQRGLVPVGEAAILRAIELNGAAVALNKRAFLWGRILAARPELAAEILGEVEPSALAHPGTDRGAGRRAGGLSIGGLCRALSLGDRRGHGARDRGDRPRRRADPCGGRGIVPPDGLQGRI